MCISDASRVLDPWHPLVHLALAGFEKEPISADFLRRYSATRHVCGLNGLLPTLRVGALHLNPRPRSALLLLRPLSVGRFASLRFRPKNMAHHISQLESELHNIPEAAPKASPSFSVSEKLAHYGSSALSGVEHLTLLVGRKSVALALIRHFGSLKGLARASFQELRQFLPRRQAESVLAALSMFAIAETEHARSEKLDNPESIYRACADMKLFNQEVLRVILLDARYRHISIVEITKGSINESLAYPQDIFRPVIGQSAYAFVLAHNHPSGDPLPSEADIRLTRRLDEGARMLQINMLDHVIVGQSFADRPGYFSFKEAGLI